MTNKLPIDIILNVLDQLVASTPERQPIYGPSSPVTKTLRALTITSRSIYPFASRYLYRHCLYLGNGVGYTYFRRTLGISLDGDHPQSLTSRQAGRHRELWDDAKSPRYITSIFISPKVCVSTPGAPRGVPLLQLEGLLDLCNVLGSTLKRLLLNIEAFHSPQTFPQSDWIRSLPPANNILLTMPNLVELVASSGILDHSRLLTPKIQKLAISLQDPNDTALTFCFSSASLNTLVLPRPSDLSATDINSMFSAYKGQRLDIIFVDVNSNHRTPEDTRDWAEDDVVRVWEADVPTSFYGDEDQFQLCIDWIWDRALEDRLWQTVECRRMASWGEVKRRLAGPVHQIAGDAWL